MALTLPKSHRAFLLERHSPTNNAPKLSETVGPPQLSSGTRAMPLTRRCRPHMEDGGSAKPMMRHGLKQDLDGKPILTRPLQQDPSSLIPSSVLCGAPATARRTRARRATPTNLEMNPEVLGKEGSSKLSPQDLVGNETPVSATSSAQPVSGPGWQLPKRQKTAGRSQLTSASTTTQAISPEASTLGSTMTSLQQLSTPSSSMHQRGFRRPSAGPKASSKSGFDSFWYQTVQKVKSVDQYPELAQAEGKWGSKPWLSWRVVYENGYANAVMANNKDEQKFMAAKRCGMRVTATLATQHVLREHLYFTPDYFPVSLPHDPQVSRCATIEVPPNIMQYPNPTTKVVNTDWLQAAQVMTNHATDPAILMMINPTLPGGEWKTGGDGPEEDLVRRSNVLTCYETLQEQGHYPLQDRDVIYCHGVSVFRHEEHQGYPFINMPYGVDIIGISSGRPERGINSTHAPHQTVALCLKKKLEMAMGLALAKGHDSIVIVAESLISSHPDVPLGVMGMVLKDLLYALSPYFTGIVIPFLDRATTNGMFGNTTETHDPFSTSPAEKPDLPLGLAGAFNNLEFPVSPLIHTAGPGFTWFHAQMDDLRRPGNKKAYTVEWPTINLPPCPYGGQCLSYFDTFHCETTSHPPICPAHPGCPHESDPYHALLHCHPNPNAAQDDDLSRMQRALTGNQSIVDLKQKLGRRFSHASSANKSMSIGEELQLWEDMLESGK